MGSWLEKHYIRRLSTPPLSLITVEVPVILYRYLVTAEPDQQPAAESDNVVTVSAHIDADSLPADYVPPPPCMHACT
jgi:hypothetical protein